MELSDREIHLLASSTPFKEDPRPLFKLLGISGRVDFFWVEALENWRERRAKSLC